MMKTSQNVTRIKLTCCGENSGNVLTFQVKKCPNLTKNQVVIF